MATKNILFVLTSHDTLGDSGRKTGWYLPEFAHPYTLLAPVANITVASPKGGEAPLDEGSVKAFKNDPACVEFHETKSHLWKNTEKLSSFRGRAREFDAICFPGGHGVMYDLATDEESQALIREFWESGKVVGAVCHGPAALVNVKLSDGSYLVADAPVTGFSNAEENMVHLSQYMPFMLETELQNRSGGRFEKAANDWASHVAVAKNGRLITGQNPASSEAWGQAILQAI